jgi:hypothetical protein
MAIPRNQVDRAVREDAAHAAIVGVRGDIRTQQIRLARLFGTVDRSLAFVYHSCASVAEYGARYGYSPEEARAYALVGAALSVVPLIEERLLDGRLTFDAAAAVAKIIVHPEFAGQGAEWLKLAEKSDLAELRRKIRKAIEEAERREPVLPKTMYMTEQDEKDFADARGLASKLMNRQLSEGETVGILSRYYLDEKDPLRAKPKPRRVPDTRTVDSRYIPVSVKREVWGRTNGECAVWGCRHRRHNQYAHLFPHSLGGHREASGIILLCPRHHREFDKRLLIIEGTADEPIFRDGEGTLLPGGPGPPDTG